MTNRYRVIIACALAVLLALGQASAATVRELQNELAGLLAHPMLQGATVGFEARSLDHDQTLLAVNERRPLMPASNMKLVTVATAFELLGADHRCNVALAAADGDRSLAAVGSRILKPSDNDLAELLLLYLPTATGRTDLSPALLAGETWGERGLELGGMCWQDGSGLSRRNLLTADFTVALLTWMRTESRWWAQFRDALAVGGVDGTLRRRMCGSRAEGRVYAKTGTLTGVSALSGYVNTRGGETVVFSMIFNGFGCDVTRVRRLQDHTCIALAQWSRSEEPL